MEIYFELADENAKLPIAADIGSSGVDLMSVEKLTLEPHEIKLVSTGLKWEPPTNDIEMQIRPRSGLAAKHGITVLNSPGTIDASYRGIIKVILINHLDTPYEINIGDKIAQAVLCKVEKNFNFSITSKVCNTTRGEGGFGSTGK